MSGGGRGRGCDPTGNLGITWLLNNNMHSYNAHNDILSRISVYFYHIFFANTCNICDIPSALQPETVLGLLAFIESNIIVHVSPP